MNDRAVGLLDHYDIEVLRTRKGRGAILCDTDRGCLIFKEYTGPRDKVSIQDRLLRQIEEAGDVPVERIISSKEDELLVKDADETAYILKTYFEGQECNIYDREECRQAVRTLGNLHKSMCIKGDSENRQLPIFYLEKEYEKHNKELKRVRRFLKEKSQKTSFEIYLQQNYDYFLDQALQITEEWKEFRIPEDYEYLRQEGFLCHGDYQYHNILKSGGRFAVINFEKYLADDPIRDLYLYMRKLLEKSSWSAELGDDLLNTYSATRALPARSFVGLYYRLAYPEKFWKIVNFYYNSGKAWIPERNMEKLAKLLEQEKAKQKFLETIFRTM